MDSLRPTRLNQIHDRDPAKVGGAGPVLLPAFLTPISPPQPVFDQVRLGAPTRDTGLIRPKFPTASSQWLRDVKQQPQTRPKDWSTPYSAPPNSGASEFRSQSGQVSARVLEGEELEQWASKRQNPSGDLGRFRLQGLAQHFGVPAQPSPSTPAPHTQDSPPPTSESDSYFARLVRRPDGFYQGQTLDYLA